MSTILGSPGAPGPPSVVLPATRARAPGWRDPRLWVGVALVAASVVLGARVLAGADDTVAVWAVSADAGPGETLDADDLVTERVRFADGDALAGYFTVDDALPEDLVLVRGLGAGELLPRAALGEGGAGGTAEVSIAVGPLLVPPSVTTGSVVDVYLSDRAPDDTGAAPGGRDGEPPEPASPVLGEVTVVSAPATQETFAAGGERQLVLAVEADDVGAFQAAMDALDDPVLTVVRLG